MGSTRSAFERFFLGFVIFFLRDCGFGAGAFVIFHAVGFDLADALENLGKAVGQCGHFGLCPPRNAAQLFAEIGDEKRDEREDRESDQREFPILIKHHADQKDESQEVFSDACEAFRDSIADDLYVIGDARNQLATGVVVEKGQIERHKMSKERLLDIGDDGLADPRHQDRMGIGRQAANYKHAEHGEGDGDDGLAVFAGQDFIKDGFNHKGHGGGHGGGNHHEKHRDYELPDIGAYIAPHEALHQKTR